MHNSRRYCGAVSLIPASHRNETTPHAVSSRLFALFDPVTLSYDLLLVGEVSWLTIFVSILAILFSAVLVLSCGQTYRQNQRWGSTRYTHATTVGVSNYCFENVEWSCVSYVLVEWISLHYKQFIIQSSQANCCMLHRSGGAFPHQQTATVLHCAADHTDISGMVNDAEDKLFHKILYDASHVLSMFLPERCNELTYSLRTRRHDRTLSRVTRLILTIIFIIGSFLKIVISIYSLIIVFMRLVMFIKRMCYVMLNVCEINLIR